MAKKVSKLEFDRRMMIVMAVITLLGVIAAVLSIPAVSDKIRPPSPPPTTEVHIVPAPEAQIRRDASDGLERENADPAWLRERQASADAAATDDSSGAVTDTAVNRSAAH